METIYNTLTHNWSHSKCHGLVVYNSFWSLSVALYCAKNNSSILSPSYLGSATPATARSLLDHTPRIVLLTRWTTSTYACFKRRCSDNNNSIKITYPNWLQTLARKDCGGVLALPVPVVVGGSARLYGSPLAPRRVCTVARTAVGTRVP